MPHAPTLQSFIAGRWIGQHGAQVLRSAIDGHELARTHEERLDFAEATPGPRNVDATQRLAHALHPEKVALP